VSGADPFAPPATNPDPQPVPPQLTEVNYGPNDGQLAIGETITLQLVFDTDVQAAVGTEIVLNNGGRAAYVSGNGSDTLVFSYVVAEGDSIADLALAAINALVGTIESTTGRALAAGTLDGINPSGTVVVDGVETVVSISASVDGLHVTSNKPGDILINDGEGNRFLVHVGNGTDPVDVVIGQLAGGNATGTVVVRAPSGALGSDPAGIVVSIGSSADETLTGQLVWGHGGADFIDGTAGADSLFGGAGNDTIRAGAGADTVYGGPGGDSIDLGADLDVDRVVYSAGDFLAGSPLFLDGGSAAGIDEISGMGIGDIIDVGRPFSGAPVSQTTYLTGAGANELAIVRGSLDGGTFVSGSNTGDNDFMVQWVTDGVVNSTILQDLGSRIEFSVDSAAGTLTLIQPAHVPSYVISVSYDLLSGTSTATFQSTPDQITHTPESATGLADHSEFQLLTYRDFTPRPSDTTYVSGPLFGLQDNVLSFNGPLASNLYSMFWTDRTFDTAAGHLASEQIFFAGGRNNGFDNDGFAVVGMYALTGNTDYADSVSRAIFGPASGSATLSTGLGHDVVLSKGAPLTIAYSNINAASEDLILDFDPVKDFIGLSGALRTAIDDTNNGALSWVGGGGGPQIVVGATTEAVQLTLNNPASVVSSASSLMAQTLATLNASLDLTRFDLGEDLLILARHSVHTGSAALIHFEAKDDNGIIDANEITFIATFNGGAPVYSDILLL
jgi:hypothetical protein